MLLFSFIMSILFCFVLISFIVMLIVVLINNKKLKSNADKEMEYLINGFKTFDLGVGGTDVDKFKDNKKE